MKKLIMTFAGIFFFAATALAQTPIPDPDTLKDPVKQTDPDVKVGPKDTNYKADRIRITPAEIPRAVKRTLESSSTYSGWEKAAVYKNENGSMFYVEIATGESVHTFRFDQAGKPQN